MAIPCGTSRTDGQPAREPLEARRATKRALWFVIDMNR